MKSLFAIIIVMLFGSLIAQGLSDLGAMYKNQTASGDFTISESKEFNDRMEKLNSLPSEELKAKLAQEITNPGW